MSSLVSLAIETSSRRGSVALARGGRILAQASIPMPRRHELELLPAIIHLCEREGLAPGDLQRIDVSLGPGSFTGLRMGIATARMLARATGAALVGVPTLEVLAQNALVDPDQPRYVAACVRLRPDSVYARLFERQRDRLIALAEPCERSLSDLLDDWPRPLRLYGELTLEGDRPDVSLARDPFCQPRAEALAAVADARAARGETTQPAALVPLYVRPPDAVEVWQARQSGSGVTSGGDRL